MKHNLTSPSLGDDPYWQQVSANTPAEPTAQAEIDYLRSEIRIREAQYMELSAQHDTLRENNRELLIMLGIRDTDIDTLRDENEALRCALIEVGHANPAPQ